MQYMIVVLIYLFLVFAFGAKFMIPYLAPITYTYPIMLGIFLVAIMCLVIVVKSIVRKVRREDDTISSYLLFSASIYTLFFLYLLLTAS